MTNLNQCWWSVNLGYQVQVVWAFYWMICWPSQGIQYCLMYLRRRTCKIVHVVQYNVCFYLGHRGLSYGQRGGQDILHSCTYTWISGKQDVFDQPVCGFGIGWDGFCVNNLDSITAIRVLGISPFSPVIWGLYLYSSCKSWPGVLWCQFFIENCSKVGYIYIRVQMLIEPRGATSQCWVVWMNIFASFSFKASLVFAMMFSILLVCSMQTWVQMVPPLLLGHAPKKNFLSKVMEVGMSSGSERMMNCGVRYSPVSVSSVTSIL